MSRNRLTYNCLGIFTSQTTGVLIDQNLIGDIQQLSKLQSFSFNINKNYQNLEELGSLSFTQIENQYSTVAASISYYAELFSKNEKYIGLNLMDLISYPNPSSRPLVQCLSGIISNNIEKNYYILVSPEGVDLNNDSNKFDIIGLGNVCLTSYQLNASIGSIPTVDIELEALNVKVYKNPSKIWSVYDMINPSSDNLYNGKVEIVNFNNVNDLMIVTDPNDPFNSIFEGPGLYIGNNNNNWGYISELTGVSNFTDSINSARYGASIAASDSGKYILIGGPNSDEYTGSALLYTRSGNSNNWNLVKKLSGVGNNAYGPIYSPNGARYGTNVSINKSGDIIMINGPYDEGGYGGALIYTGTNWNTPAYKLSGSQSYTMGLGADMNEDGSVIILGGGSPFYFDGVTDIFTGNQNIGWKLAQTITGENGGQHGRNCAINDKGDVILLNGPNEGSCLIYTGNATTKWGFAQKIIGMNINSNNNLSINSDGSTIVFGSDYDYNLSIGNGMISIYTGNVQNKWSLDQIISGKNDGDYFGQDVAINYNGDVIASLTPGQFDLSYFGVVNVLNKNNIQGLPSVDPDNIINTNELLFNIPNIETGISNYPVFNPGDIKFQMSGIFGFDMLDLKIQDFSLSIDLNRNPLKKLGKQYPFVRELNFPIKARLEINCLVGDLKSGNLSELICGRQYYDFDIKFTDDFCKTRGIDTNLYMFKKAKLISQNFTTDIGNSSTMNAVYEIDLSNPNSINEGIFLDFRA